MPTKENRKEGIGAAPAIVTARRALGITKTYVALAVLMSVFAVALWGNVMYVNIGTNSASNSTVSNSLVGNALSHNAALAGKSSKAGSGTPLLAVPLDVIPVFMLITPVVLLFVYDKNNGVLEYLLSLGMTQRDIYMRYLKAALLLVSIFSILFVPAVLAYTYAVYGASTVATILPIPLLAIPLSFAVAAFMVMAMMAFSSLQKTRAGSNQPLGLLIGWLGTASAYLVPFILPFKAAIYADLGIAAIIAIIVLVFLMSSEKLIRREKFLP
ncbi:MAG: hypothetical protein ABSE71_04880 [Candidatus Micrarchaeaceae archaeon]|jgi:hypothetical protein|nr:hypothetical protein [Candidatus Micrarchaeota archaeon]HII09647.1 hypothetical protein [Candidatus Micrarchaeota archaeon]